MSIIGSHPTGQTSMQAPHVVHAHTASGAIANSVSERGLGSPAAKAVAFSTSS